MRSRSSTARTRPPWRRASPTRAWCRPVTPTPGRRRVLPGFLWQSLFRDDTALKFRLKADPALWAWSWKFLKECPAERAAINTANKLRLCMYSQGLFDEINRTERIAYDRHVGGALYLYRDREHFDRGVGAMKVLTDGGVRLEPIGPDRIVEIEPALSAAKG